MDAFQKTRNKVLANPVARPGPQFSPRFPGFSWNAGAAPRRKRRAGSAPLGKLCRPRRAGAPAKNPWFPGLFALRQHGTRLAILFSGNKAFGSSPVSLNGIAASALSALKTNSAALGVVSNNVTNLNTPGYARRVVNLQTLVGQRPVDGRGYRQRSARGRPVSLAGKLSPPAAPPRNMTRMAKLFSPAERPAGRARRQPVACHRPDQSGRVLRHRLAGADLQRQPHRRDNALNSLASTISNCSSTITALQTQIDGQVVNEIAATNTLIKQIYDLNKQIKTAKASGGDGSGLLDQRDVALQLAFARSWDSSHPAVGRQRQCLHHRRRQSGQQHLCHAFLYRRRGQRHLWQYPDPGRQPAKPAS